jgi:CheY-like chemotaxis protein
MEENRTKVPFARELSKVLHHLYDPSVLRNSPLVRLLGLEKTADATSALRDALNQAIESLRPDSSVPPGSNAWRVYHILYGRYTEQSAQSEVATDIGLSIRQLRRHEKAAVELLADYVWTAYDLEDKTYPPDPPTETHKERSAWSTRVSSRMRELEWLKRVPSEATDVREMVQGVLELARPLMLTCGVSATYDVQEDMPPLAVQRTVARQALLQVITEATRCVPGGQIDIHVVARPQEACGEIQVRVHSDGPPANGSNDEELEMARELTRVYGGSLEVTLDGSAQVRFAARLILPTAEQVPVLVIDDNVDTLHLVRRYLSGSRSRFIGTSDPQEVVALADELHPRMIVLDVMLPGVDGWEVLARLREHPATYGTPILVCTILAQEDLAMLLGAADFVHKPINRQTLLSALDRQFGLLPKGCP